MSRTVPQPPHPSPPSPTALAEIAGTAASLEIRALRRGDIEAAAWVAARALRDNPTHIATHGDDEQQRLDRLYLLCKGVLRVGPQPTLCAVQGDTIVGVLNAAPPGHCKPSLLQQLRMLPPLLRLGADTLRRMARFGTAWAAYDPRAGHWHLGPVAVEPGLQGLGIGSQMMSKFCAALDASGDLAYLETDTLANVAFYRRFGFEVSGEATVLDARAWFMRRVARVVPG